jgi:hypothetical protein
MWSAGHGRMLRFESVTPVPLRSRIRAYPEEGRHEQNEKDHDPADSRMKRHISFRRHSPQTVGS